MFGGAERRVNPKRGIERRAWALRSFFCTRSKDACAVVTGLASLGVADDAEADVVGEGVVRLEAGGCEAGGRRGFRFRCGWRRRGARDVELVRILGWHWRVASVEAESSRRFALARRVAHGGALRLTSRRRRGQAGADEPEGVVVFEAGGPMEARATSARRPRACTRTARDRAGGSCGRGTCGE